MFERHDLVRLAVYDDDPIRHVREHRESGRHRASRTLGHSLMRRAEQHRRATPRSALQKLEGAPPKRRANHDIKAWLSSFERMQLDIPAKRARLIALRA